MGPNELVESDADRRSPLLVMDPTAIAGDTPSEFEFCRECVCGALASSCNCEGGV